MYLPIYICLSTIYMQSQLNSMKGFLYMIDTSTSVAIVARHMDVCDITESVPESGGDAGVDSNKYSVLSRRFGDASCTSNKTPSTLLDNKRAFTSSGVASGLSSKYNAATPATCGAAMDVPLMVLIALSFVYHVDSISTPGANIETQPPKLLKEARRSLLSVAPTEITADRVETDAGDVEQASTFSFPAATTTTTFPTEDNCSNALFNARDGTPPRERLQTVGLPLFIASCSTNSMPLMTPEFAPLPSSDKTLTPTNDTAFATP